MEPINTEEEFLARLPANTKTARLVEFRFGPVQIADAIKTVEPVTTAGYFVAGWLADSKEDALWAAEATLQVIAGRRAFIRVPPEADSQRDWPSCEMLHKGYVRASFLNEPGEWEYPKVDPPGTIRLAGLLKMGGDTPQDELVALRRSGLV